MQKVYKRELAKCDIMERFIYLTENASLAIADKFLTNAEESFNELAINPLIGSPLKPRNKKLAGMRKWHIKDFDNTLIFYMPRNNGISIVRVLHAAQNWWGLLGVTG